MTRCRSLAGLGLAGAVAAVVAFHLGAGATAARAQVRAQVDTVGFATTWTDMQAVVAASRAAEGLAAMGDAGRTACLAAILPHDDYLYAGRTVVHALPYLQAPRWVMIGVCHACRRAGVRDQLLFDASEAWRVAGRDWLVDEALRDELRDRLGSWAVEAADRHAAEHSLESLLPWIGAAVAEPRFVPILVAGMEFDTLREAAGTLAAALAAICRERGWQPGRDLALAISADAVHYGCEGWGATGYAPFGCDERGHAAARQQDLTLADATLAGPLDDAGIASYVRLVWNPARPSDPADPYRITWCGLYSIPFGLTVLCRWLDATGAAACRGELLRYGDSVSDGRLDLPAARLGVTAPATLAHWVGYPALVYLADE
ncbi:MAG TPA: AmmeMemoRadiSam system protein B [Candidatus Krumholzibacteria bacterium]|nr:AmmeMemoRadiSam system protein B [Candidatus Krumholzibacteria bacterium]HPD70912.1 AmmeMemoRadiSam system protein B [Candidatus Krumholzibacteria bacterium]HRY39388.1 AmmeMemoRadiSam system protein B [Candidatus Krumholzibacteria bacterium]